MLWRAETDGYWTLINISHDYKQTSDHHHCITLTIHALEVSKFHCAVWFNTFPAVGGKNTHIRSRIVWKQVCTEFSWSAPNTSKVASLFTGPHVFIWHARASFPPPQSHHPVTHNSIDFENIRRNRFFRLPFYDKFLYMRALGLSQSPKWRLFSLHLSWVRV